MDVETPEAASRTVFVRGISYAVAQDALEEAFGAVGPVRKCFLVKSKTEDKHKGYGYVQFALREDAASAVAQLHNSSLGGRKLKVDFAAARPPLAERKRKAEEQDAPGEAKKAPKKAPAKPAAAAAETPAAAQPPQQKPAAQRPAKQQRGKAQPDRQLSATAAEKQRLVLTVAVGGIPPGRRDAVLKLAAGAGKVASTDEAPPADIAAAAKLREDGCTDEIVFVTYTSGKDVLSAVSQLHGRKLGPPKRGKGAAAKAEAAAAGGRPRLWARQVAGEGAHHKKWRLILRNLSFQVNEAELRKRLGEAGFVWELSVARDASGKPRGFAFASFTCRADAERAILLVNQQVINKRPVAVDWAIAKSIYQTAGAEAAAAAASGAVKDVPPDSDAEPSGASDSEASMSDDDELREEVPVEDERSMQRSMLDALLRGNGSGAAGGTGAAETQPPEAAATGDAAAAALAAAGAALGAKAAVAVAAAGQPSQRAGQPQPPPQQQQQQKAHPAAADGPTTIFLRNLPTGTTEPELRSVLSKFGPLKACRLVIDKATGQPKGTAFAEYKYPDSAAKASAQGQGGATHGIMVAGRKVLADLALSKDDARALAQDKAGGGHARDRRNLYLSSEGDITDGSPAWESVPPGDRERRKRAVADKALKLRSPNFAVSATRLAVRNIPASMNEAGLKQLAVQAVKAHASKAQPRVKQVKILSEAPPAGSKSKAPPKSRGRGFIEFTEHEHALCALRQLNNNPTPFGSQHRPIVEFAIDDTRKLLKRRQRLSRPPGGDGGGGAANASQQRRQQQSAPAAASAATAGAKRRRQSSAQGRPRAKQAGSKPAAMAGPPSKCMKRPAPRKS